MTTDLDEEISLADLLGERKVKQVHRSIAVKWFLVGVITPILVAIIGAIGVTPV